MLQFDRLSFAWPKSEQSCIKSISLQCQSGESVAIIGDNGAGKSTFLKLTAGLLAPTQGQITLGGIDIHQLGAKERAAKIGFLFQEPERQFFHNTVVDEISYGMKIQGISSDIMNERIDTILKQLHLEHCKDAHPLDLNAAEKRMVTIASLAVLDLSVLLLDEPSRDFDDEWLAVFEAWLQEMRTKGVTILAISHDYNFVKRNFERIITLSSGAIILDQSAI